MLITEKNLRSLISAIILESETAVALGSDLTPPEPYFQDREVKSSSIGNLKMLQAALSTPETGKYDYATEKAWDTLVMGLTASDVEGVNLLDIATSWESAAPKIQKVRGKPVTYTSGIRGMLNFVRDIKPGTKYALATSAAPAQDDPAPQHPQTALPEPVEYTKWVPLLGKYKARNINFNKLEHGRNNYRGGMDDSHTVPSAQLFRDLKEQLGIETVITLNSDEGGKLIPGFVRQAGLESIYIPIGAIPDPDEWKRITAALDKGNTLIHCAHGADRTGGTVGRWYVEKGHMSREAAIADMLKYKGGNPYRCIYEFVMTGRKYSCGKSSRGDGVKVKKADALAGLNTWSGRKWKSTPSSYPPPPGE